MGLEDVVAELTLEEKVRLLTGQDVWRTAAVPRLGIGSVKMSDGPSGVRGGDYAGPPSASFPAGVALGATFDPALVREVAAALAAEARHKHVHVLLGPTINLHRGPLGGRGFECYSEDPRLTEVIAGAFVEGLQGGGVAACAKHYVANDTEAERMTASSEVDDRTLREVYLRPFEAAVRAGAWVVMSAYNRIRGTYAAEHHELLVDVLKGEWGFDGVVVSDWFGARSTVGSVLGGLDLEMPGPPIQWGDALLAAIERGEVTEADLDDKVRRILRLGERCGRRGPAALEPEPPEGADDDPGRRACARRAAAAATVLLRNEPVEGRPLLPVDPAGLRRVALLGPLARELTLQGGGSAQVSPHPPVALPEALRARLGAGVEVVHEPGCTIARSTPVADAAVLEADDGEPGATVEYFADASFSGSPLASTRRRHLELIWMGPFSPAVPEDRFAVRCRATLVAPVAGPHVLGLTGVGRCRLLLDGEVVVDNWTAPQRGSSFFGMGSAEVTAVVDLAAGERRALTVEYERTPATGIGGLQVGCQPPIPDDLLERAERAAAEADLAVVVVGTTAEWETEGRDREAFGLPGDQDELVERVLAANPRTVVVLNAGSPVGTPWAERAPAVLDVWFPGMEAGPALVDVLVGDADPGGRLPVTFPRRLEDTPSYLDAAPESGRIFYGERVFVGHRWYHARGIAPRWPFGHGLSYATFEHEAIEPAELTWDAGGEARVVVRVRNTSDRDGDEVVQAYLRRPGAGVTAPPLELVAVAKARVPAGATAEVELRLEPHVLRTWDATARRWRVDGGRHELAVGRSCEDLRLASAVTVVPPAPLS